MLKRVTIVVVLLVIMIVVSGCQVDMMGPSATAKIFYKGENGDREFLSRGSGMSGGSSYAAGGGAGSFWSWGGNK